jgi:hypothetical protein
MFVKRLILIWQMFTIVMMVWAPDTGRAGEIGMTPDGNVIYRFDCPGALVKDTVGQKIDWYNHMGEHPEWDLVSPSPEGLNLQVSTSFQTISREGQKLVCKYRVTFMGSSFTKTVEYQYKVKRDIIRCDHIERGYKCILKGEGGGTSSSSATSSSQTSSDAATDCCIAVSNPGLKGRFGRLIVTFPAAAMPKGTRVAVLKNGNEVQAGYGSQSWELLSGTYEIKISDKTVSNVMVKAGHDTNVKVGVLRISAGSGTRAAVLDSGKEIASGYGNQLIGLPAGSFDVQVAGQTEKVTISEGQITDF